MNKIRHIVLTIVLLIVIFACPIVTNGQAMPNPTTAATVNIRGFHLVSPTEGWVWTDRLYWTKDAGQSWTDITPTNFNSAYGSPGIAFADNQHGTVVIAALDPNPAGAGINYSILQTTDGGRTWSTKPLSISPADALAFYYPSKVSLQFLDAHIGWLRIRHEGGDSDSGLLFKTIDGGVTWSELNLPVDSYFKASIGDPVYFATEQLGWIATDPQISSNLLYRTQDGGKTWKYQTVGIATDNTSQRVYNLPQFVNTKDGLLPVWNSGGNKNFEEVYITHDGGITWQLDSSGPIGLVKMLDSTHWIGISNGLVQRTINQAAAPTTLNADPALFNVRDMDFVSPSTGLAFLDYQICPPDAKPGQCIPQHQLLYTSNGGKTWKPLALPPLEVTSDVLSTVINTSPGFDTGCLPNSF